MTPRSTLPLLVLAAHLSACTTITHTSNGTPIRIDALPHLQKGHTTTAEVLELLGPPQQIVRSRDGDLFLYQYETVDGMQMRFVEPILTRTPFFDYRQSFRKRDTLAVMFDKQGLVDTYGYAQDTPR